jgi:hypothetical protein
METKKYRTFKVVGVLNKDTKVLGFTYEKFQEILKRGFSAQFAEIQKKRSLSAKNRTMSRRCSRCRFPEPAPLPVKIFTLATAIER